jgi:hypothetical protein
MAVVQLVGLNPQLYFSFYFHIINIEKQSPWIQILRLPGVELTSGHHLQR